MDSGLVETRSLDDSGRAAFSIPTSILEYAEGWFAAGPLPLLATPDWSRQAGDLPDRILLDTFALGPSPLQDTVIQLMLAGPRGAKVEWTATFAGKTYEFAPLQSYTYAIEIPAQGSAPLRMPAFLTRPKRPQDTIFGVGFQTSHTRSYRGVSFMRRSFDSGLARFHWPPETEPISSFGQRMIWNEIDLAGTRRWIRLDRIDSTRYRFLQLHSQAGMRTREDSGTWDPRTGTARFLERRPGLPESFDSSSFIPQRILQTAPYPLAAWREAEPPLDSAMRSVTSHPTMKFFRP